MRTRTWLALLAFSIVGMPAAVLAQEGTRKIVLMPHWKKGEKRQYSMVKSRRNAQGVTAVSSKGTTPIRIEVLDVNDAGYLIGWTAGETRIEDPAQAADPFSKAMVDLTKDTTIVFQLDSYTKLQGVWNWRQLQALAHKTTEMSLQQAKKIGMNDAAIEQVRQQFLAMFATKPQVEAVFTRTFQIFFAPLGLEHSTGRPREYDDKLPNPFGGEPFPTRASFTLEKVDPASDTATVTWRQEIDPVAGASVLEKTLKDLAARLGRPLPAGKMLDFINIKDEASFAIYLSSGWPQQLSHTRTTIVAGASQEESLTFIEVKL